MSQPEVNIFTNIKLVAASRSPEKCYAFNKCLACCSEKKASPEPSSRTFPRSASAAPPSSSRTRVGSKFC